MAEISNVSFPVHDYTCSICMEIFLEPVTLPCEHTFCKSCFKLSMDKTSIRCPLCRHKVGTWARYHGRQNTLINSELWERIQREYPKECWYRVLQSILGDLLAEHEAQISENLPNESEDSNLSSPARVTLHSSLNEREAGQERAGTSDGINRHFSPDSQHSLPSEVQNNELSGSTSNMVSSTIVKELNQKYIQEELDRQLAMKLQTQLDKEWKAVTHQKSLSDDYGLHLKVLTRSEQINQIEKACPSVCSTDKRNKSSSDDNRPLGHEGKVASDSTSTTSNHLQLTEMDEDLNQTYLQEQADRELAIKLQRKLDKQQKVINRQKGSLGEYGLRLRTKLSRSLQKKQPDAKVVSNCLACSQPIVPYHMRKHNDTTYQSKEAKELKLRKS